MGDFLGAAGQNPIYSFIRVIDTISLSAYSPNLSQEKGFPESREWGSFQTWSHEVLLRFRLIFLRQNTRLSFFWDKIHVSHFSGTKPTSSAEPTTLLPSVCRLSSYSRQSLHSPMCEEQTGTVIQKFKRKTNSSSSSMPVGRPTGKGSNKEKKQKTDVFEGSELNFCLLKMDMI